MSDVTNFTSHERMGQICIRALDAICRLVGDTELRSDNALYAWLSEEVGMTDEEIKMAGFECVPESGHSAEPDIRKTINRLKDLASDRESFFREDGDDEVFREDFVALCDAVNLLEELEMLRAYCDELEE